MSDPFDDSFVRRELVADLRRELSARGMTQTELARRLDTTSAYVSRLFWFRDNPSLQTIAAVARAIGLTDTAFDRLVTDAKRRELGREATPESSSDPETLLRDALEKAGLDDESSVADILRYIDYRKHVGPPESRT